MRIVIDARLYGLENGGLGRYSINLIKYLQEVDSENEYFILLRKKYFESENFKSNFKKVLADIPHYSLKEQMQLKGIIKKLNPDLTHFLHFNVPLNFNDKFIVTIHDMLMHKQTGKDATTLSEPMYRLKRLGYKKVFEHAVGKSQKVIVPSNFVKEEVVSYFKTPAEKVEVTYEGVETYKESEINLKRYVGVETDIPYFLYVGNAYPHKNLKRAIEACRNLKVNFYIVCGRSVFTQRLEEEIEELKASEYVKLLGFTKEEDLQVLYRKAIGFIYPSLSEGFGLPGLEAMSAGTMTVVSDIPVFREVYKENVIYFDPTDVNSIEQALRKTMGLTTPQRLRKIKEAKEFVKRYSWEKMVKETLEIYRNVI